MDEHYDVIIIGSGAGGGTLAHRLAPSGKKHPDSGARRLAAARGAQLERRRRLRRQPLCLAGDLVRLPDGKPFQPQVHYFVGGATKMFGAALYRLRKEDFGEMQHYDGISPAWPITYDELEPYYTEAEQLYQVHGAARQRSDRAARQRALSGAAGLATSRAFSETVR